MNSYEFVRENNEIFKKAADVLTKSNLKIAYGYSEPDMPYVGNGHYVGEPGFYFRAYRKSFGVSEEKIKELFPMRIDEFTFKFVSFWEYEVDDDRDYPESIAIAVFKNNVNVLNYE
tara:strand:+ start:686 stop:1033 length:348 start_codon:yes stop_codon:yes gene_type:complete